MSTAIKRLMSELKDLNGDGEFIAAPLEDDLLEWHFTIRGPPEGGFQGGRYHGRLLFPTEYPFKPPNIIFLTPNGRFQIGKKICLSITGYHPESWRPSWGIRTALIAIISFFLTKGEGAIGALDWPEAERAKYAKLSRNWKCPTCGSDNSDALPDESEKPSIRLEMEKDLCLTIKSDSNVNLNHSSSSSIDADKSTLDPNKSDADVMTDGIDGTIPIQSSDGHRNSSSAPQKQNSVSSWTEQVSSFERQTEGPHTPAQMPSTANVSQTDPHHTAQLELEQHHLDYLWKIDMALLVIFGLLVAIIYQLL